MKNARKGMSGSTLKIIAVVAMTIDHVAAALLTRILMVRGLMDVSMSGDYNLVMSWIGQNWQLYYGMQIMRLIGRLGFPLFCFLLVEGFQKTRSVGKYAMRLGLFALISEIPFDLAFSGKVLEFGYQNVYFTLFIGILALWGFDWASKHDVAKPFKILLTVTGILLPAIYVAQMISSVLAQILYLFAGNIALLGKSGAVIAIEAVSVVIMLIIWGCVYAGKGRDKAWRMCADLTVLFAAMLAADLLRTDYAGMGVLTIAVMYLLRRGKVKSILGGCVVLTVMSISEFTSFLTLIPVAMYNGKRGWKMKYFFYAFYPVHLLIIWLIAWAMGMGWISAIG